MTIPKIIHQIWIQGFDSIPPELKIYHSNCQKINNNFEYEFWDEERIKQLLNKHFDPSYLELYNKYQIFAQKADFARYAILKKYGGIYLDMDMICHKNMTDFLPHGFFFTSDIFRKIPFAKYFFNDLTKKYLNGIIGCRPDHPVFDYIFTNMFQRQHMLNNVVKSTGTRLFYDSITQYVTDYPNNDMTLIDDKLLHPCKIYDDKSCATKCKDCYVAHTNHSSWSPYLKFVKIISNNKYIIVLIVLLIVVFILMIKSKFI